MNQPISDPSSLKAQERWLYGGLGALAPIIVTAITLDVTSVFKNPDYAVICAWIFRCVLLFLVGGFVAFLHRMETDTWKCFVTGISAPALITTAFAGNATKPVDKTVTSIVSAAYGEELPQFDLKMIGLSIPVYRLDEFGEGLSDKLSRGFYGRNPYVSFVVLPAMSKDDATRIAALLKIYNQCLITGQIKSDFDPGARNEFSVYQNSGKQSSDVFIVSSPIESNFIPVVSAATPQSASAYGFMIDKLIRGSGVLVVRQSELEEQLKSVVYSSRGSKAGIGVFSDYITSKISVGCSYK